MAGARSVAMKSIAWPWPLRGKYADGKSADVSNVDICADKTVDLVN